MMSGRLFKLIFFFLSAVVALVCGYFGRVIPFAEQWPLFEALRTTASIIFAVVGAWLAIIYPDRLKISFHGNSGQSSDGIAKLFTPVVNSTVILCIILVVGFVAPILKRQDVFLPYLDWCRGFSYFLLSSLTIWQLWTVILTLIPADVVKSSADQDALSIATVNNVLKRTQRK